MKHPSRRLERNPEFVEKLKAEYEDYINLTGYEDENLSLEGTGSLVIDRLNHQIFMSVSDRSSIKVLEELIEKINAISSFNWKSIIFNSTDEFNKPVYHTNVVLSLTPTQAIINLESINQESREIVINSLKGYQIVIIGHPETRKFAGNIEALYSPKYQKEILFISKRAEGLFELDCETVYIDISVIEQIGGGSTQCMLAKLF